MLHLKVQNFKCFSDANVDLNKVTVLCGGNGSGKSSLVQAILLYRAAIRRKSNRLRLNGPFGLALGITDHLLPHNAGAANGERSGAIRISVTQSRAEADYLVLDASEAESRQVEIASRPKSPLLCENSAFFFNFLSAERSGPRLVQEAYSEALEYNITLGAKGEYVAQVLGERERVVVRPGVHFPLDADAIAKNSRPRLLQMCQSWMSSIVGPIEIRIQENGLAPPSLMFKKPGPAEDWVHATSTGFGLTQVLPIVVAGLLVPVGGFLVVESPEVHLHPAAQSALAKFLARVAGSGVNVILETHSDHIIDGIRVAVADPRYSLVHTDCSIVNVSAGNPQPVIEPIQILANGALSSWPKGFFDQQAVNLRSLADLARAKPYA